MHHKHKDTYRKLFEFVYMISPDEDKKVFSRETGIKMWDDGKSCYQIIWKQLYSANVLTFTVPSHLPIHVHVLVPVPVPVPLLIPWPLFVYLPALCLCLYFSISSWLLFACNNVLSKVECTWTGVWLTKSDLYRCDLMLIVIKSK